MSCIHSGWTSPVVSASVVQLSSRRAAQPLAGSAQPSPARYQRPELLLVLHTPADRLVQPVQRPQPRCGRCEVCSTVRNWAWLLLHVLGSDMVQSLRVCFLVALCYIMYFRFRD